MSKIVIILLNWNGKKDTLECLFSLEKVNTPHFTTIVVDNGSTDDSVVEIRKAFPNVPILETGMNLGFAEGNNRGIEWALRHKAEWILLLNNDTVVDPEFLNAYLRAAKKKPKGKILGGKILSYNKPNLIDHLGGYWAPKEAQFYSPYCNQPDKPDFEMEEVDYVCGASLFMHRSVPETIGLLEPNFFLFWEESDFCIRAKKNGFEVWTVPEAIIWHKVSSSFTGGKPHTHYFWWRSRLLWIERNCNSEEKRKIYRQIIIPEIWKMGRHYIIKSIVQIAFPTFKRKEQLRKLKAGCTGVFHFFRRKFGNCPVTFT